MAQRDFMKGKITKDQLDAQLTQQRAKQNYLTFHQNLFLNAQKIFAGKKLNKSDPLRYHMLSLVNFAIIESESKLENDYLAIFRQPAFNNAFV